jgi:hypothetical protein
VWVLDLPARHEAASPVRCPDPGDTLEAGPGWVASDTPSVWVDREILDFAWREHRREIEDVADQSISLEQRSSRSWPPMPHSTGPGTRRRIRKQSCRESTRPRSAARRSRWFCRSDTSRSCGSAKSRRRSVSFGRRVALSGPILSALLAVRRGTLFGILRRARSNQFAIFIPHAPICRPFSPSD